MYELPPPKNVSFYLRCRSVAEQGVLYKRLARLGFKISVFSRLDRREKKIVRWIAYQKKEQQHA
jgi:hypothetical protein